jgi:hypothetical protein
MLKELYQYPELGFIHSEMWFARTIILVQYWRSTPPIRWVENSVALQ